MPIHNIVSGAVCRLRDALCRIVEWPRRRAARKKHAEILRCEAVEPVLGFGGVLDPDKFIHGGAVKLLSLRDRFRCDDFNCNILYLVSSAQPPFAEELVRVCRSRGIKFVWNQNGVGYPAWAGAEAERHNAPMRRLRALADFVVYQSDFCRESAAKFLGPCESPSAVLLNPVDLQKFHPPEKLLPPSPLRLLAMGTQNYRDRVFAALECVRELRGTGTECTLTVAGPLIWRGAVGDVRKAVEALGLHDCVRFLPPFRQDEAPSIYRDHHLLLHPKYMDPCPTVVAEALACGLPVVAARSGGIPEMVDDLCAKLIDVQRSWEIMSTPSGTDLASAVREIFPQLGNFSGAARRRAENFFDAQRWIERHAEIFRSVLATD